MGGGGGEIMEILPERAFFNLVKVNLRTKEKIRALDGKMQRF